MLSVMIFCHDKREGDLIGKICNQCVALIDKEFLRNFIISDEEYHQVNTAARFTCSRNHRYRGFMQSETNKGDFPERTIASCKY